MKQNAEEILLSTIYGSILLAFSSINVVLSVVGLIQGLFIATVPLVLNLLVMASYFGKIPYGRPVVKTWAVLLMIAGVARWLSWALRGELPDSSWKVAESTAFASLGVFFFVFADSEIARPNTHAIDES